MTKREENSQPKMLEGAKSIGAGAATIASAGAAIGNIMAMYRTANPGMTVRPRPWPLLLVELLKYLGERRAALHLNESNGISKGFLRFAMQSQESDWKLPTDPTMPRNSHRTERDRFNRGVLPASLKKLGSSAPWLIEGPMPLKLKSI
ncbi:unnamed protein product [Microthlaspi erraticum]|uniref:Uncharacterized protein n=1 Tax=Microthlaspi erraticum TaxID=1685480 RepID=A0A6D2JHZ1_9BRAS|nr:unnamed protein product [Microthlaspi erraticum]